MLDEQSRMVEIMNKEWNKVYEDAPEMDDEETLWPH